MELVVALALIPPPSGEPYALAPPSPASALLLAGRRGLDLGPLRPPRLDVVQVGLLDPALLAAATPQTSPALRHSIASWSEGNVGGQGRGNNR